MLASGWHAQLLMSFLKMTVKLFQFLRDQKDHDLPYCLHIGGQPIIHSRSFKDGFVSIQDKRFCDHVYLKRQLALLALKLQQCDKPYRQVHYMHLIRDDEGYDVEKDHDLPYCLHIGGQPIIHSRSFKDGFVSIIMCATNIELLS
jgi:hypothetical protein